jgi:hypothetical protein
MLNKPLTPNPRKLQNMKTNTISGTYGSGKTPCQIFTATTRNGRTWYAVEGSSNVNLTYDTLTDGVDVETVADDDAFTWPAGIDSEETLAEAIEA